MNKDSTYVEKLTVLKPWLPSIIQEIKKDLKNDHLKKDWAFTKNYFNTKNVNKLTVEDLSEGYEEALKTSDTAEAIGEFIANRWLLKNTEIYHYFEERLSSLTEDFNELTTLEPAFGKDLAEGAAKDFGVLKTYIFSVFNSVVLPGEIFKDLNARAFLEEEENEKERGVANEELTWKAKEKALQQQIARLTEKYEKKLLGLERKYENDTKMLKKQIASLQQKVSH